MTANERREELMKMMMLSPALGFTSQAELNL